MLLPPHDPWLQASWRELVVPDAGVRKQLWRAIGNPGVILVDGEVAGMWRPRRKGKRLGLAVTQLAPLGKGQLTVVEEQAHRFALARGAREASVDLDDVAG